jgi:DNA helicase II / ATP-dependent DNA helicase PcrA
MFNPREGQQEIIRYQGGKLGITAVPGSGKTHTLSYLAAKLFADDHLLEDQEILIVTLVNSAVNNFASRISEFLKSFGLVPGIGYRVRTLHGLAYDIVREQPQLAGMDNQFSIADERTSNDIISIASINWIRTHPEAILELSADSADPAQQKNNWANLVQSISRNSINFCKDMLLSPDDLLRQPRLMQDPLFAMVQQIFTDYERALYDRGSVDFSDLIRLAFTILQNNPGYLSILQDRWPFILEDEAQDSSKIQEELLSLLSSRSNNWVRVGDPNQAIFETFTTADPRLLRQFVSRSDVSRVDLPRSGRSTTSIISLANYLIDWTRKHHPEKELRYALDIPLIKPTAADDPQPNPIDVPETIHIFNQELSPDKEIEVVANSARKWLQENPDKTLAILIPRNARGAEMAEALSKLHVPVFELLSTSRTTRETASVLADIFTFFAKPLIRRHLTNAFASVALQISDIEQTANIVKNIIRKLKTINNPETLFTKPNGLEEFASQNQIVGQEKLLFTDVFSKLQYWESALLLPIDECTVTIGADLFKDAADLALTHKIALILQKAKEYYPDWTIENFAEELQAIASNRYKLYGFSEENFGFDPDQHKGEAVVSTMHKAKGLEWDRVYLMSVNNYNFPSLAEFDEYVSEKWFVKDRRNLEAEVIQRIRTILPDGQINENDLTHEATHQARVEFCAERLRLLYVGITRARAELIITWNNGKRNNCVEALPLRALREFWEKERAV